MKKTGLIYIPAIWLILLQAACIRQNPDHSGAYAFPDSSRHVPFISFDQRALDLGRIMEGETAGAEFRFKNTGKTDLIITNIQTTCGCTVPKWEKKPVPPGSEGSILVLFDSRGRTGLQNKSVRIISNAANNEVILAITAEVIPEN